MTKLEKQMKKNGLNKYNLYLKSGVNRFMIDQINNYKSISTKSISSLVRICMTLNCKLSDIIENDDECYKLVKEYEDTIYLK